MDIEIEQEVETQGPELFPFNEMNESYMEFFSYWLGEFSKRDLEKKAEELVKTFSSGGKIDWDLYKKALQLLSMLKEEAEPLAEEDQEQEAISVLEPAMTQIFEKLQEEERKHLGRVLLSRILNSERRIFLNGLFRSFSRRAERLKRLIGKRVGCRKVLSSLMEHQRLEQEKIANKRHKLNSVVCKRNALRKEYNAQRDEPEELFPELVELERIQEECLFEQTLQLFHLLQENIADEIRLNAPSELEEGLLAELKAMSFQMNKKGDGGCGATVRAFALTITRGCEGGQCVNLPILV